MSDTNSPASCGEKETAEWGDWKAQDYLHEFYVTVDPDTIDTMRFLVEALGRLPKSQVSKALDFGTGPALYTVFSLVPAAQEIHLSDYLPGNRDALQRWVDDAPGAYDWKSFVGAALRLERQAAASPRGQAIDAVSDADVSARERETRERVTQVLHCDASLPDPMGPELRGSYPVVASHYCAEGATRDRPTWFRYLHNIESLVQPGGMLIVSAVEEMTVYPVGEERFPATPIRGTDLLHFFEVHGYENIDLRRRAVPERAAQGFAGCLFISGTKTT
ncbi:MAG: guanitoxin biosynthesis pre-guanitoxin forming N-methyltransferase GntF [Armatimonadota bacterium]